jgi:hypothetical protein
MTRGLLVLVELGLLIFTLVECVTAPSYAVRRLPKGAWLAVIVLIPIAGAIAWLAAGRPVGPRHGTARGNRPGSARGPGRPVPQHQRGLHPLGPDDDPEFLRQLGRAVEQRRRDDGQEAGPG